MQLQTERFTLRPLAEHDAALFQSLYRDEGLMRHIGDVMDEQRAERAFRASLKAMLAPTPKFYFWVIEEGLQQLGVAGLSAIIADEEAEPGMILLPHAQNKRVGFEVLRCLVDYCRDELQLQQVVARFEANNFAAAKLAENAGFHDFQPIEEIHTTGQKVKLEGFIKFPNTWEQK
ncbi:hypothetical protein HR45_12925 [Shewanella mangrovi]|uniref:N-acetyltransferase domain-containing protein n=1 Tax=Shewanella mangrovi TaxID=1515746 RepID=A0A094JCJ6_9GAMM|nr:GNAT family N-acetyltransferase [Shewanella mangrovi]KFZ36947.1 hypothetical protein HR45_12925 [Shewanella mangrovi]